MVPVPFSVQKSALDCLAKSDRYRPSISDELFSGLQRQRKPFVIERNGWESQDVLTEIARILLVESMGYEVEVQTASSTKMVYWRLAEHLIDFNLEVWKSKFKPFRDNSMISYTNLTNNQRLGSPSSPTLPPWLTSSPLCKK